jgi:hypothetical protein
LKYAGATAAVVGASALGLDYLLKPTPPIKQAFISSTKAISTTSLSSTSSVTTTETSTTGELPLLDLGADDLGGYVFHDYNGNGTLDEGEPFVNDVEIVVQGNYATVRAQPSHGLYVFRNLPKGSYRVYPVHPQDKFRYMCRSNQELVETRFGYLIDFNGKQRLDVGLMEGFETLPFLSDRTVINFVDDGDVETPNNPLYRDWQCGKNTYPGHQGIDYAAPSGTPIVAAAPGVVIGAEDDWQTNPDLHEIGNRVVIDHLNGYRTAYNHLSEIKVRKVKPDLYNLGSIDTSSLQKVRRGELIATVGRTGSEAGRTSHLHFEAWPPRYRYFGGGQGTVIDHYRDLCYGTHGRALFSNPLSLWTIDNDSQYTVA